MGETKKKEVQTVFTLLDKASHGLHKFAEKAEKAERAAEAARQKVEGMLGGKLAAIGLSLGMVETAHRIYEVGEEAEHATRRIAGLYAMSGRFASEKPGEEMTKSLEKAEREYEAIEDISIRGVAYTRDYAAVVGSLDSVFRKTHGTTQQVNRTAAELVARFKAMGMPAEEAAGQARALGMVLEGVASRPPRELLKVIHMSAAEFKKFQALGPDRLWDAINKRIEKTKVPLDRLFKGPDIQLIRLRNMADHFMRVLGAPVMEELGNEAQRLVKWLTLNKDQARQIAEHFAKGVVKAIHWAIEAAKYLSAHWKPILAGIGLVMGAPKVIGGAIAAAKIAGGLMKVARAAGGFAARMGWADSSLAKTMMNFAAKIGPAVSVFAAGMVGFQIGSWLGSWLEENYGDRIDAALGDPFGIASKQKDLDAAKAEHKRLIAERDRVRKAKGWKAIEKQAKVAEGAEAAMPEWFKGWKPEKVENNFDFRGSKFDIKQEFAQGFDPGRVSVAFTHDLATLGERSIQSGFAPLYTVR